jgi:hypothetical protein
MHGCRRWHLGIHLVTGIGVAGTFSKVDGVGSSVDQDRAVVATGMDKDGWKDARRQRGVLSD